MSQPLVKTTSRSKSEGKKKLERHLQAEVLSRLNLYGGKWFGVKKTNEDGCPDIIGWYNGYNFAIELKIDNNKTSFAQDKSIEEIKTNGGDSTITGVCRSFKEVFELVKNTERSK